MNVLLRKLFAPFLAREKFEQLKIVLLSGIFLCVIASYTMLYDLKNSIFMSMIGKEYVPWAKMASMFILFPAVLFYSFLVDNLRRYQLLYFYSIAYGIFGLVCAYVVGSPSIGLLNTDSSPFRIFGWIFYFFVEGFPPFVVSLFWAFANSISSPSDAKENYGILVSASKFGGMLSAGFAWWLLTLRNFDGDRAFSDAGNHQILLIAFSIMSLLISFMVYMLMKKVPGRYLHGYEAAYRFEKEKKREQKEKKSEPVGVLAGLTMMFQQPYILGIFGMLFFYEVLNTILSYQRLGVAQLASNSVSDISYQLYQQTFFMHLVGFFISIVGTQTLLRKVGERTCLIIIPLVSGLLLFYFWMTYTPFSLLLVFVCLKSVNYAFATPVRESLYIPTIKDVKFKSKSWIDAFGSKFARSFGSSFNIVSDVISPFVRFLFHGSMFAFVIGGWFLTAFLLGKRYAKAIKNNEVIGG